MVGEQLVAVVDRDVVHERVRVVAREVASGRRAAQLSASAVPRVLCCVSALILFATVRARDGCATDDPAVNEQCP